MSADLRRTVVRRTAQICPLKNFPMKTINIIRTIDSTKIIKDKGIIIRAQIEETIAREEDIISTNI
jgi:hypothetical protein